MIATLLLTVALAPAAQGPPESPPTVGGADCVICQGLRGQAPPGTTSRGAGPQEPPPSIADDAFLAALFAELRAEPGNLFLSPWSVQTALEMALAGAGGSTAEQLEALLAVERSQAAARFRRAQAALEPPLLPVRDAAPGKEPRPCYQLDLVNAAWAAPGLSLRPAYQRLLHEGFGAALARQGFEDAAGAAAAINGWGAERTDGRIRELIRAEDLDANTLLVLVNAIRFQADWAKAFAERKTEPALFTTSAGVERAVPMMHRLGEYGYAETEALQAVRLDYRGGQLAMILLLPKDEGGLPALEASLRPELLRQLPQTMRPATVDLRLPRFQIDRRYRLDAPLRRAGMIDAFDAGRADFSGIAAEPMFVSAVLHQAGITVDERGTEASAATAVQLAKLGYLEADATFTADRPFLFLIRHRDTGAVLFLGRVDDPSAG